MTNYPRDEFDRVPEFSNRSGAHRANGWAAAASGRGARPGLRWLMVFGVVALLVGVFSFTALPKLLNDGGAKPPSNVAASGTASSATPSESKEPETESESPKESDKSSEPADASESEADPSESASSLAGDVDLTLKVGVYNGAKKSGLANTVRTTLQNAGFTNVSAANWTKQVASSTVYYRNEASRATAEEAAKELGITSVVKTSNIPGNIAVVLGNTFS
ncbi:LytR C-terminal domain-containing protein [Paeniglutamicibacter sp. R2-26]|uniref:LytR C-terminal domain-containing protein n=1 Tax=Paeniglutamicibacter sp. R2-26 TaxID=3144417 RepID=UPI003EE47C2B